MSRILMFVQKYKSKIKDIWKRNQKRLPTYIFLFIAGLYLYGEQPDEENEKSHIAHLFSSLMFGRKEKTTYLLGIL